MLVAPTGVEPLTATPAAEEELQDLDSATLTYSWELHFDSNDSPWS